MSEREKKEEGREGMLERAESRDKREVHWFREGCDAGTDCRYGKFHACTNEV